MGRRVYLSKKTPADAARILDDALSRAGWPSPGDELVSTEDAVGRVTARAVMALTNAPAFASCAMDGYALRAALTFGATDARPALIPPGQFVPVNTGNPLPEGCDAVVKIEDVNPGADGALLVHGTLPPWRNVRRIGENAVVGTQLLPSAFLVTPAAASLLLAASVLRVPVRRRPRVLVIPTGDELAPAGAPEPGKVPETNGLLIAASLRSWGAEARVHPIVGDDAAAIRQAVETALPDHDMVILNAGSSAGSRDHAADVLEAVGELLVHGVALRPGKPLILGLAGGRPVVGLPGYPLAALVDLDRFVRPLVLRAAGLPDPPPPTRRVRSGATMTSSLGDEEVIRGKLARVGGVDHFHPLPRGSAALTSAVRADALTRVAAGREGVGEGEPLEVEVLPSAPSLELALLAVGSHDLLLDLLADRLARSGPVRLDSIHVGSMGGLRALGRGAVHLAGIHLRDEASGLYNDAFVDRFLPGTPVALVHLCMREQGLMVAPGNPRRITGLADLVRPDLVFVNRQGGSGTRILLDQRLRQAGLAPDAVTGYDREETTHVAVAAAVAGGFADCGLGVRAAATALGLDFLPLEQERYDLLVEAATFRDRPFALLLEQIRSEDFRLEAEALGGYSLAEAGRVLREP